MRGDNTDGVGFIRDVTVNQRQALAGRRIVVLGAGGAARGIVGPLLAEQPAELTIANRTKERAEQIVAHFGNAALAAHTFDELAALPPYDVLINATSAGLKGETPPFPASLIAPHSFCYDLVYGSTDTPFVTWAKSHGAARAVQGWGMLVEQAAESFAIWRGMRPDTRALLCRPPAELAPGMMSETAEPMTKKPGLDYASAGVDYGTLDASKILAQKAARATAVNLAKHGATEIEASRGESAYLVEVGGVLIASITECLGTKTLVADAVRSFSGRSHYDTIAQDTLAMAVNDLVTVGATPLSSHAYWSAGGSAWFDDKERMQDLVRGWQGACDVCSMSWGGGETPALGGVVEAQRIDLAASCVGIVKGRDRLMLGERLAAGDAIVLLASSGIHANGISLARKLAERLPNGYRTRDRDGRSFGEALLDPTVLYAPITEQVFAAGVRPHYAVNVTGHGWRKLMRHPAELRYVDPERAARAAGA